MKILIIAALILWMLSIYGIFSFSYGFASISGPSSSWEFLTFKEIRVWPDLFSNGKYFFVAITDTGKAYLSGGTADEIGAITGVLYAVRNSIYSDIPVVWWFVFPIISFIILLIPGHHKKTTVQLASVSIMAPPTKIAPKPVTQFPKKLTEEEKTALARRRKRNGLILGIIGSVLAAAVAVTAIVINVQKEQNRERTAEGNSLAPAGRHPFVIGSMASPITSGSKASNTLMSHSVVDVYYSFDDSDDSNITIPENAADVVFCNASPLKSNFSLTIPDSRTSQLVLGFNNVRCNDILLDTKANCEISIKYAGLNDFYFPREINSRYSSFYLLNAPNADMKLIASSNGPKLAISSKSGSKGNDGTNGENPTTNEATCDGGNGSDGSSTVGGIHVKSIILIDQTMSSCANVTTGNGGDGGNGGKHGWYFGVLGIGSHDGKDETPGYGGMAGFALTTSSGKATCNGFEKTISSGNLVDSSFSFRNGNNGNKGRVNN